MFGQQAAAYRFSSLTDKEAKAVLDEALGLSEYAEAGLKARQNMALAAAEQASAELEHRNLIAEIDELTVQVAEYAAKHKSFATERDEELEELRKKYSVLQTKRKIAKELIVATEADDKAFEIIRRKAASTDKALTEAQNTHMDALSKQKVAEQEYRQLCKQRERIAADTASNCGECGAPLNKKDHKKHLDELQEKCEFALDVLNAYKKNAEAADEEVQAARKRHRKYRDDLLSTRTTNTDDTKRLIANLTEQMQETEERGKTLRAKESPYQDMIKRAEAKLVKARQDRDTCALQADVTKNTRNLYTYWTEAFGAKGLRSFLIDTALPYLNERAAHYASVITDNAVEVEFTTQTELKSGAVAEKLSVIAKNKFGAESYKGNSAGERAKIDLCVGLSLQDLVMSRAKTKTNIAFFDEVFESLDATGCERVVNVLSELARERSTVMVITHHEELKNYFPERITVTKKNGFSRIEA